MSLIPLLFDYDEPCETRRHYFRHPSYYDSPWNHLRFGPTGACQLLSDLPACMSNIENALQKDQSVCTVAGKDGFHVRMDVQQFKPEEITVKTAGDCIVVEGRHEDKKDDHGYVSRHFVRKYQLPKGYDAQHVTSTLSSDGVLSIKTGAPTKQIKGEEKAIEIKQTGEAHRKDEA